MGEVKKLINQYSPYHTAHKYTNPSSRYSCGNLLIVGTNLEFKINQGWSIYLKIKPLKYNTNQPRYVFAVRMRNMPGSRKFVRGGPNLITVDFCFVLFLVDQRIEDPNTTINKPSSARQRNAIPEHFIWNFA